MTAWERATDMVKAWNVDGTGSITDLVTAAIEEARWEGRIAGMEHAQDCLTGAESLTCGLRDLARDLSVIRANLAEARRALEEAGKPVASPPIAARERTGCIKCRNGIDRQGRACRYCSWTPQFNVSAPPASEASCTCDVTAVNPAVDPECPIDGRPASEARETCTCRTAPPGGWLVVERNEMCPQHSAKPTGGR